MLSKVLSIIKSNTDNNNLIIKNQQVFRSYVSYHLFIYHFIFRYIVLPLKILCM